MSSVKSDTWQQDEVDALIVGAGFSGLYMLKRLRDIGLSARIYEEAMDVGGTWYWNRYPGAGSDSDALVYCFSDRFSEEILREWEWSERYPSQPELLRYLQWVADKLDLRRDIWFGTRVDSAVYDNSRDRWDITTDAGHRSSARYFIPAVGPLSYPLVPDFPGADSFLGECCHTARLPHEGVDFTAKRVAVIGQGATAVQVLPHVAKHASHVVQFVRNPSHCLPGRNHPLNEDDWGEIHAHHKEIWEQARQNFGGFPYEDFIGAASGFSAEKRQRIYEERWQTGGFRMAFATFSDVLTNKEANDTASQFHEAKVHNIVQDPGVADLVTPTDPFVTKRPPIEHGYYAALNRNNVTLVDIKHSPIVDITPNGIRTRDEEYAVDVILLATGFDALTGSLLAMNIQGSNGLDLNHKWANGPRDYLGLMVNSFPNMFMIYCGPYNPGIITNGPTLIEQQGEWIVDCIKYLRDQGYSSIEPLQDSEDQFMTLHEQTADATLIPQTDSWWTGSNVEGKTRTVLSWCGGFPEYRRLCDEAAAQRYEAFAVRRS